jgi:hypothetical protein
MLYLTESFPGPRIPYLLSWRCPLHSEGCTHIQRFKTFPMTHVLVVIETAQIWAETFNPDPKFDTIHIFLRMHAQVTGYTNRLSWLSDHSKGLSTLEFLISCTNLVTLASKLLLWLSEPRLLTGAIIFKITASVSNTCPYSMHLPSLCYITFLTMTLWKMPQNQDGCNCKGASPIMLTFKITATLSLASAGPNYLTLTLIHPTSCGYKHRLYDPFLQHRNPSYYMTQVFYPQTNLIYPYQRLKGYLGCVLEVSKNISTHYMWE